VLVRPVAVPIYLFWSRGTRGLPVLLLHLGLAALDRTVAVIGLFIVTGGNVAFD
jgi:hypothetical protein